MPTPEEIKKIAEEFAEYKLNKQYPSFPENLKQRVFSDTANIITEWLEFLSKDFCIVPKRKLQREYKKSYSAAFEPTTCLDRQYARGRYQVLREIFGKSLFEEE